MSQLHHYKIGVQTLFSWMIILWCGWSSFIPLTLRSVIGLMIILIGIIYGVKSWSKGINTLDGFFICLVFVFPIFSAIQAYLIFGQPILHGILSLRGMFAILIYYALIKRCKPACILKIILEYQLYIMVIDTILLYVLGVDSNSIVSIRPTDGNEAFVAGKAAENQLRGLRLSLGASFTLIALAYWIAEYHFRGSKETLYKIVFTFFFVAFVSKSRVELVLCLLMVIIPYLININLKKIIRLISVSSVIGIVILAIPSIRNRFLVINDLFGGMDATSSGDYSGYARLAEILIAWPHILAHPFLGVGNISYHYKGGFMGIFNDYFFVADIGVVGMLLIGGLFLCWVYWGLFYKSYRMSCKNSKNKILRLFALLLAIVYIIIPFTGQSPLMDDGLYLAVVILFITSKYELNGKENLYY